MDAFVLDFGTGVSKIGIGGDAEPLHMFRTVVADDDKTIVGIESESNISPIKRGNVENWEAMENVYNYSFNLLGDQNERLSRTVLLAVPPMGSKLDRETSAKYLFEKIGALSVAMVNSSELSLYQSGMSTGLVVSMGHGSTYVAPIYEHNLFSHAVAIDGITGTDIDMFLSGLLSTNENNISALVARSVKESGVCYVAQDFDEELKKDISQVNVSYELPDGREIVIGRESFLSCEAIFDPEYMDKDAPPIHKLISSSINKCDINVRKPLYSNIHVVGGHSLHNGFVERLRSELRKIIPQSVELNIFAGDNRSHAAWTGGSVFSQLSTFKDLLVTKEEFDERGVVSMCNTCGV